MYPLPLLNPFLRPTLTQAFAALLALVSLCIVFGETTIPFTSYNMSPFSQLVLHLGSELPMQLLVLLPLV